MKAASSAYLSVLAGHRKAAEIMFDLGTIQKAIATERYVADHEKTAYAEMMISRTESALNKIIAHEQVSKIVIPDVEEGEALVHGRINDKVRLAYSGFEVRIESDKNETISTTKTDESGYYSFVFSKNDAESLEKELPKGVTISVYDKEGNRISHQSATVAAGDSTMINFLLQKTNLADKTKNVKGTLKKKSVK